MVFGNTTSFDGDVKGNHSVDKYTYSIWVFKINGTGELLWQQCIGGKGREWIGNVVKINDYKYVVAGVMDYGPSFDVDCSNHQNNGYFDYWVFEITDTTVGLPENKPAAADISVSPNPAKTYAVFKYGLPANAGTASIEIRNMSGQLVHEIKLNDRKGETVWMTGNTTPGIYIYILKTNGGFRTGKLVVTK